MTIGFAKLSDRVKNDVGKIGQRPTFYLAYLIFFFAPWLFKHPSVIEIILAVVMIAIFIPLHYRAFERRDRGNLVLIALIEGLALISAPLNAHNGVFHIFAVAQIGYQRPAMYSMFLLIGTSTLYAGTSFLLGRSLPEIGFTCFLAVMVWGATLADAERVRRSETLVREHELDKQQNSIVERERIARDLHDLLGHTLTMVALKTDLAGRLIDSDPIKAKAEILDIRDASRKALNDVRAIVSGMLSTNISDELRNAEAALGSAGVSLDIKGSIPAQSEENETVMALSIREAVTNIIRHSGADHATIEFKSNGTENELRIEDNGRVNILEEGTGLAGLRSRVEDRGGQAVVDTVNGVRIAIILPKPLGDT